MLERVGSNWNSNILLVGVENGTTISENSLGTFLMKLNIYLCYDLATPILSIYPHHTHTKSQKRLAQKWMYEAVLKRVTLKRKVYCYSSIKRNKITDTNHNVDESQKYAEEKKFYTKRMHTLKIPNVWNPVQVKLSYGGRNQFSLGVWDDRPTGKGLRKLSEVLVKFDTQTTK